MHAYQMEEMIPLCIIPQPIKRNLRMNWTAVPEEKKGMPQNDLVHNISLTACHKAKPL